MSPDERITALIAFNKDDNNLSLHGDRAGHDQENETRRLWTVHAEAAHHYQSGAICSGGWRRRPVPTIIFTTSVAGRRDSLQRNVMRPIGAETGELRGIKLATSDKVVGMNVIRAEGKISSLSFLSGNGLGNVRTLSTTSSSIAAEAA